jgi:predicted outer membrane lipoprotein
LPRRLFAWPVASNWSLGLLLAAAFWMPHVRGCDGKIVVPSDNAAMLIENGEANKAIISFWPYAFGLLTALAIFIVAALRFQKADQLLLAVQVLAWCSLWGIIAIESPPKATQDNADLIPPLVLPTLWCVLSIRKRDWITAWARLTTTMAVLSIPWLFLTNLFGKETYYGMVCAYVGIVGLAIAP